MQHAPRLPHVGRPPPPLTCSGWPRSSRELGLSGSSRPPMNSRKEGTKAKPSDRRQPQLSAWVTACPGTCQLLACSGARLLHPALVQWLEGQARPGRTGHDEVDELGHEDEEGEHQLVQLVQGAAELGRRHLCSTCRPLSGERLLLHSLEVP